MAYKSECYKPNAKSRKILDAAWAHIQSVDYPVSVRWLFYRGLQDGFYSGKSDYQTFVGLTSKARHNLYAGWRPDTLVDDKRNVYAHEGGERDTVFWIDSLKETGVRCDLDHWYRQSYYVELWFEAEQWRGNSSTTHAVLPCAWWVALFAR